MADTNTSVFSVADYFLNKKDYSFCVLKMIKICYLSYGWCLSFYKEKLFYEEIQAWKYGPVIPELYYALRHFRGEALPKDCLSGLITDQNKLDEEREELLDAVVNEYGKYKGIELSAMTHKKGTPWREAYTGEPFVVIEDKIIKKHFDSLRQMH